MIEVSSYNGEGFKVLTQYEGWRVAMLRYCERFARVDELERHLKTDEIFVLLEGKATLYTDKEEVEMVVGSVYNVPVGVWHHIVVSEDASVLIVENADTAKRKMHHRIRIHSSEGVLRRDGQRRSVLYIHNNGG